MIKFEKVLKFKDVEFDMPARKTAHSAGYDMVVAEDIIIPPYRNHISEMELLSKVPNAASLLATGTNFPEPVYDLAEVAKITKSYKIKPTLVSTGVKCYLDPGYYLEVSVRSSTPLKYWLMMANGVGIIDADYADNPDNEGEIFFQLVNFTPWPIQLRKGDVIGQGIIKKYEITDDDAAAGKRLGGFGSTSTNSTLGDHNAN